ncbi:S-layer homology domain-containing protein [Paenibacillus sp. FSL M8-0334]|uniref:S-layer protein n=1 Tax=Paenibacillus campinasensis TaxID=66347 RepID=A0ABW9T7S0_9BACL|nr:S-layer homology domain-containing protein [Paenibacillus campinasensis]MUG68947.1 S-layer protein [Paenibacillus campinasensis]
MRPFKSSVLLAALVLFFGWTWTQLFGNVGILVQAADDGAFAPLSSDFAGGSGTEEAPYIIETAEQLNKVRDYLDAHFKLGADINLSTYSSGEGWLPIATEYSSPFTGTFDGNGYQITGLKINREDENYQSLFGVTSETAVIRNVHLEVVEIKGYDYIGGLVGYSYGIIENSTVTGTLIRGEMKVGGLAGIVRNDVIGSSAHIEVVGEREVGGLAGLFRGSTGKKITIRDSFATGDVAGINNLVGGLVGIISSGNIGSVNEITNSYATGEVNGDQLVGGFVGKAEALPSGVVRIKNSYATGNVNGKQYVGGLIGFNVTNGYDSPISSVIEVEHCYATGKVTGHSETGGLVGANNEYEERGNIIEVAGSYWLTDSYTDGELPDNGIGIPVEEADLRDPETFKDWDLTEGWYQYDGHRPFLQWQNPLISWAASIANDQLNLDDKTHITVNTEHQNGDRYNATTTARYSVDPDDPEIVRVDPNGEVSTVKGGKATITVSLFDKSETLDIVVDSGNPEPPTITLHPDGWTNAAKVEVAIDHSAANPRQTDVHTIRVKVGDKEWEDRAFNGTPIRLEVTEEGQTKIQAQAMDDIGNKSTIVERTVKISRSGLKLDVDLYFTDNDSKAYPSGTWTNQSVTAAVYASHDHGIALRPIAYSLDEGAAWEIYHDPLDFTTEGQYSLWFRVEDVLGNEMSEHVLIRIDHTNPEIELKPDGDETLSRTISSQVNVKDDGSGIDAASLRYVWSTSSDPLDEHAYWQPFINQSTLSHADKNGGDWYLHIYAKDQVGQESYRISRRFRLEREPVSSEPPSPPVYIRSGNATLRELILSEGALIPEFSGDITTYKALIPHDADSIQLTIRAAHHQAGISVNGRQVRSDQGSIRIPLHTDTDIIDIVVTAEDGTRRTYSITVERMQEEMPDPPSPEPLFADIAGHWAEPFIQEAYAKGIIAGYPDGTFRPDHAVTRAEFTLMLVRALRLEGEAGGDAPAFADGEQIGEWAKQAIDLAARAGIVSGYEDGTFRPGRPVTRVEMAVMIARATGAELTDHTHTRFADDARIPAWAKSYVEEVRIMGIIHGRDRNLFAPNETLTRAEAVTSILRLLELLSQ